MSLLAQIIKHKKEEIKQRKIKFPLKNIVPELKPSFCSFKKALLKPGLNLIAEIKRVSPSSGLIRPDFELEKILQIYRKFASAISVITDQKFFGGSLEHLKKASRLNTIPILQKDFVLDPYQIYEARCLGANAILLIARILETPQIRSFLKLAQSFQMDVLVEIHDQNDLEKALATPAEIIGINNRNLDTLEIDLKTTFELAPLIPTNRIVVSESGFQKKGDLSLLKGEVNAVLIGSALLKSPDLEGKIREMGF